MKKFLAALLTAALSAALLAVPAAAAAPGGQEHFTDGAYTFTRVNPEAGGYAPLNDNFGRGDDVYFSDGLLLMRTERMQYDYLGEDGRMHDLNRGRFDAMFPFSEGLAAVVSDNRVGYIDTEGNLVIPCQFGALLGQLGSPTAAAFRDGKAWVFRYRGGIDASQLGFLDEVWGGWAQIDQTGKLLTDYSEDASLGRMGIPAEVYEQYNLFCPDDTAMGMVGFTEECSAPNVGTFQARFGSSDTGLVQLPTGGKDANGQPETILYVVQRDAAAKSRYQSTAKLTDAYMADLNYDGFHVTVTNPTENRDSGTVALVLASHMITIHFIDYDLAPHESRVYDVNVVGHMGHIAPTVTMIGTGLSSYLNADLITFSSDEDLQAYRAAIPYEQNAGYYVTQGGSIGRDRVVVCDGRPGDDWLARYTGIRRHDAPTADAAVQHDICKP